MKILQVIHGYPMRYNAGSEVYTQTLCHALAKRHEVHVFTREEDPFARDFQMRTEHDADEPRITVHLANNPRNRDKYREPGIDRCFAELLDRLQPDIVHVGHLNHLSTSLLAEAAARKVPIVYTLHDYWLMCPRGQFMQMQPEDPANLWAACDGQENRKCAERCYARYFSGAPDELDADLRYWTGWVDRRMTHMREMAQLVDLFIAPARYLQQRYRDDFGVPESKLIYLDYGFALERLQRRRRTPGERFTFGYIGTHIPAKGIHQLIEAFGRVSGDVGLRIWGRPRGQDTAALKALAQALPAGLAGRVEWLPEYRNQNIVEDVFNHVDVIVVPSVWVENSPLVIHEAQQVRVPVITADAGGMAEYVRHEVNGLLYQHRSPAALTLQMQRLVDDPPLAQRLGARAYLGSTAGGVEGDIVSIDTHVAEVERLYDQVRRRRSTGAADGAASGGSGAGLDAPWRITFDTNPDLCNLRCIMCEEHSPHSTLQALRIEKDLPRRLMPIDLIRKTMAEAAPHGLREIIPSTMGEPLLYADFEQILALCDQYKVKLNLTTNGTFPRLGARQWAERIVPVASDVKISWNGANKATHEAIMLGSPWEKALANARAFIAVRDEHANGGGNRCRVTFQLTFLESNVDQLVDIIRLAIDLGVDRVKGHHLWAHFDAIKAQSMRRSPAAVVRWNAAVLAVQQVVAERLLPNGQRLLLENIFTLDENRVGDIAPGGQCPFLGKEAWVSAAGRFAPCCAPDAERRTLGEFGNLHQEGIMQVWGGDAYRNLLASYQDRPLCRGCNMRKPVQEA
jgi:glycosyltransferase involved in cell wall biosynthesis/MoaA/NifB/PqqE/SkfB family radical SAM enzyme